MRVLLDTNIIIRAAQPNQPTSPEPGLFMARSYVRQNVVNRFELQPRSGERSYDSLFTQISTYLVA